MTGSALSDWVGQIFQQSTLLACGIVLVGVFLQTANPIGILIPGNAWIFVTALMARLHLPGQWLWLVLAKVAAVWAGCLLGYWTGHRLGPQVFEGGKLSRFKPKLEKFFAKHGRRATSIYVFVPFVRSGFPMLAGASNMQLGQFAGLSAIGALAWITLVVGFAHMFGQSPEVRRNIDFVVIAVGLYAVGQMVLGQLRSKRAIQA